MSLHVNQAQMICATEPTNALIINALHVRIAIVGHQLTTIASIANDTTVL